MKPLDDIRVLDLTRIVAGPFCTMQLADMGADVIKVEEPVKGDDSRAFGPPFIEGEAAYFLSVNRGKRSLALDLKHPSAPGLVKALVERSDVFIENSRPGSTEQLGFGYSAVSAWNPRIVYCSISGFGTRGAERDRPGYDLIVQGASGIMDITGDPDGPPMKVGTSVADLVTALYATQAILLALRARDRLGRGQKVEVAMIDAVVSLLTFNAGIYFASGRSPTRRGNEHPTIVPYQTFPAADGWLNVAVANDSLWRKFCNASGLGEGIRDDPRFATAPARVENRRDLLPIISKLIERHPKAHWVRVLGDAGVPCGEIRTVAEVCEDPVLRERGVVVDLPHKTIEKVRTIGTPVQLADTPGGAAVAAPALGEHTRAILAEVLQLSWQEITSLEASGAVRAG